MKNKNNEIERVKLIVASDNLSNEESFKVLFLEDLVKLLKDYFNLSEKPKLNMEKNTDFFNVSINFSSTGVKGFYSLPK